MLLLRRLSGFICAGILPFEGFEGKHLMLRKDLRRNWICSMVSVRIVCYAHESANLGRELSKAAKPMMRWRYVQWFTTMQPRLGIKIASV